MLAISRFSRFSQVRATIKVVNLFSRGELVLKQKEYYKKYAFSVSYFVLHRASFCREFEIIKENPNFQCILDWILQILLYHGSKQHKNIENLQFSEQNIVIFFCPSLCLLRLVLLSTFSTADVFQFLGTVLCEILNVTSNHSCRCIKSCIYNNFNLCYFVSSSIESLHKIFSS